VVTATARAAGAARLRGDRTRAGALQASLRVSYNWIRHISDLHPMYYARFASNTLVLVHRSAVETPDTPDAPDPPCLLFSLSFYVKLAPAYHHS